MTNNYRQIMKKHHPLMALRLVLVTLLLTAALGVPICQAQITPPNLMSYQGYLTDGSGSALGVPNPKNYNVLFRVWNAQTGGTVGGSSELYAEQQTVTVDNGYFSVLLGQGSSYPGEPTASAIAGVFTNSGATKLYVEMVVLGIGPGGHRCHHRPAAATADLPLLVPGRQRQHAGESGGQHVAGDRGRWFADSQWAIDHGRKLQHYGKQH